MRLDDLIIINLITSRLCVFFCSFFFSLYFKQYLLTICFMFHHVICVYKWLRPRFIFVDVLECYPT